MISILQNEPTKTVVFKFWQPFRMGLSRFFIFSLLPPFVLKKTKLPACKFTTIYKEKLVNELFFCVQFFFKKDTSIPSLFIIVRVEDLASWWIELKTPGFPTRNVSQLSHWTVYITDVRHIWNPSNTIIISSYQDNLKDSTSDVWEGTRYFEPLIH